MVESWVDEIELMRFTLVLGCGGWRTRWRERVKFARGMENLGGSEGVEFVSFKKVNNWEGGRRQIRPGWWKERLRSPSDSKLG